MLARSHYFSVVHLFRLVVATPSYRNVYIDGEAIRKACLLYPTQASPDFVGDF